MKPGKVNGALLILCIASFAKWADCQIDPEKSVAPPGRIFELLALNRDLPTTYRPKYRSPCDMKASPDGKYLYVAEQTAKRLAVIDFQSKTLLKEVLLPNISKGNSPL